MSERNSVSKYAFTVFTPTHNRAYILPRLYESLKAQTFRDFEWLIVDDGSVDDTRHLVMKWAEVADFPIRYIYQRHAGAHFAINRGVQEARGELFLAIGDDDAFLPNALERYKYHWDSIPAGEKERFSSVSALCMDQHGNLVGGKLPQDVMDSNYLEMHYKYKLRGEKCEFYRTEIMKRFPFPAIENQDFLPGSLIHYAIARNYKTRFVNEPLRVYWYREAGRFDQQTNCPHPSKYAVANELMHRTILNHNIDWFKYAPEEFLRSAIHYVRFAFHAGKGLLIQARQMDNALAKALWVTMLPVGILVYLRDRCREAILKRRERRV